MARVLLYFPVLQYEPNNATAKEFYPLILEKLQLQHQQQQQQGECGIGLYK